MWAGIIWFRIEISGGSLEHGKKFSYSIKRWEFLEWLRNCWLFKDSDLWSYCVCVYIYIYIEYYINFTL
jgi:hypothetical protein